MCLDKITRIDLISLSDFFDCELYFVLVNDKKRKYEIFNINHKLAIHNEIFIGHIHTENE